MLVEHARKAGGKTSRGEIPLVECGSKSAVHMVVIVEQ
jgi:hypothetical protein